MHHAYTRQTREFRRLKIRSSAPILLQETKINPAHMTANLRGSRVPQSQGKTNMLNTVRTIGVIAPLVFLTACAVVAPPYSPDVDNIQSLKNVPAAHAKVGAFDSQADLKNPYPVPLRANSLKSPVGNSFGAYLADAMTKELLMAGKLSPESDVEIKATLLENDIDVGVATGAARLSARFIVMRSGSVRYDRVKSAHTQWDSAFAAMIAVPKAREEYPLAVQKLLGELYADPAFIQAIQ